MDFEYLKYLINSNDKNTILVDLMEAYGQDVWNFAYGITRKREMADDIAQDVFIKVFRHFASLRSQDSIKAWLLAITRNTARDYLRSAYIRRVTLVDTFADRAGPGTAEDEAMDAVAANEIWEQVLSLPVKYREVLILFAHHQLSMKEIAAALGVSEGTVKSRLFHARTKLAKRKER